MTDEKLVRYIHKPNYLVGFSNVKTSPREASKFLDIDAMVDIELNLHSANIVKLKNKIIYTDKIFKANSSFSSDKVIDILTLSLDISEVIITPEQPFDITGHSDGLVRFIDEQRVLISPYKKEDREFEKELIASLIKHNYSSNSHFWYILILLYE